jgi:hypothetical protein
MVEFSEYVSIAYEVAEEKGIANQLRGPGTQQANNQFMSQLGQAYNENNHSEASRSAAYAFLEANVGPP